MATIETRHHVNEAWGRQIQERIIDCFDLKTGDLLGITAEGVRIEFYGSGPGRITIELSGSISREIAEHIMAPIDSVTTGGEHP